MTRKNIVDRSIWYITTGHVKYILKTDNLTSLTKYRAAGRRNTFYAIPEVIEEANRRGIHITENDLEKEMFSGGYPPIRKEPDISEMLPFLADKKIEASKIEQGRNSEDKDIGEEKKDEKKDGLTASSPLPPLTLTAYVDGSFNSDTGVYGSAVIILDEEGNEILKNAFPGTQYNEMWQVAGELRAAIAAVTYAEEYLADSLLIRYDYEGIEKWATGEWRAKKEGSEKYVEFMQKKRSMVIRFEHVRAHTGNKYNEMADDMAKAAAGIMGKTEPKGAYTGGTIYIPDEKLTGEYAVSPKCLSEIRELQGKAKKAFGDYAKVHVYGCDYFSGLKEFRDFHRILHEEAALYIAMNCRGTQNEKIQACRWAARGMTPEEAIRKVDVDREIMAKKNRSNKDTLIQMSLF